MICCEAKFAIKGFLGSFVVFFIICLTNIFYEFISFLGVLVLSIFTFAVFYILSKIFLSSYNFQITIRSVFLGIVLATGIYLRIDAPTNIKLFGTYMCVMAIFHYSEFLVLALIDPKLVSINSFVINHSREYTIAAISSWVEFFIETYFYPNLKQFFWISNVGLSICIGGDILRKAAMFNAGTNFNHLVQYEKAKDHNLITSGTYKWFRHPSYVGWFYWSIGTQIILLNPVCLMGYTVASWLFFKQRIYIEEITLLSFFGQEYCEYQTKVRTGLPFINGYLIN